MSILYDELRRRKTVVADTTSFLVEESVPFYHVWFTTRDEQPLLAGDLAERVRGALQASSADARCEMHAVSVAASHVHLVLHLDSDDGVQPAVHLLQERAAKTAGLPAADAWAPTFRRQRVPLTDLARIVGQVTDAGAVHEH